MSEGTSNLSGAERAAVLLMALGEQQAASVLSFMEPTEVQALSNAMTSINNLTQTQIAGVLGEFATTASDQSPLNIGSDEYLKSILVKGLGDQKAKSVLSRTMSGGGTDAAALDVLKWIEPQAIAEGVRNEHPQVIALLLVHLDPDQAGEVLSLLSEEVRSDVVMRVATLDGVHPAALKELGTLVETQFSGERPTAVSNIGGIKTAAEILKSVATEIETDILENVGENDADLKEQIQAEMFVFENLLDIDDRGVQAILRDVPTDSLVIALKGSSEELLEKILKNMSKRAAELLKDDLDAKGPVRLSDVEQAQKEILEVVMRMAEDGQVTIGGKGEEFV